MAGTCPLKKKLINGFAGFGNGIITDVAIPIVIAAFQISRTNKISHVFGHQLKGTFNIIDFWIDRPFSMIIWDWTD
jgi:hypothetical protein